MKRDLKEQTLRNGNAEPNSKGQASVLSNRTCTEIVNVKLRLAHADWGRVRAAWSSSADSNVSWVHPSATAWWTRSAWV